MRLMRSGPSKIIIFLIFILAGLLAKADVNFAGNLYSSYSHILPYKGTDFSMMVTASARYNDFPVVPFVRFVNDEYRYIVPPSTAYINDRREAIGAGLDIIITPWLKLRAMDESVKNESGGNEKHDQPSYGAIYNQYLGFKYFDLNNYAETFYIPRVSITQNYTYARVQALKPFTVSSSEAFSNVLYPFLQFKANYNGDINLGVDGHNASVGGGYKFFRKEDKAYEVALVLEAHSLIYQSKDFNSDWVQAFAAFQLGME